jgi:hypothetical protein
MQSVSILGSVKRGCFIAIPKMCGLTVREEFDVKVPAMCHPGALA